LGLPDIFGKTVFDELLILELVEAHEDSVIAGFRARFEVEDHGFYVRGVVWTQR